MGVYGIGSRFIARGCRDGGEFIITNIEIKTPINIMYTLTEVDGHQKYEVENTTIDLFWYCIKEVFV
jgi:hypothetical protein